MLALVEFFMDALFEPRVVVALVDHVSFQGVQTLSLRHESVIQGFIVCLGGIDSDLEELEK